MLQEVLAWTTQLVLALMHLHTQPHPILHRDVKQANVFLDGRMRVKLGDFGLARTLTSESQLAVTACGTPYYLSPELCMGQPYNDRSDCWALGCLVYELMTLKRPFHGNNLHAVVMKICHGDPIAIPASWGSNLVGLVDSMLQKEPNNRPSMSAIAAMPFVADFVANKLPGMLHRGPYEGVLVEDNEEPPMSPLNSCAGSTERLQHIMQPVEDPNKQLQEPVQSVTAGTYCENDECAEFATHFVGDSAYCDDCSPCVSDSPPAVQRSDTASVEHCDAQPIANIGSTTHLNDTMPPVQEPKALAVTMPAKQQALEKKAIECAFRAKAAAERGDFAEARLLAESSLDMYQTPAARVVLTWIDELTDLQTHSNLGTAIADSNTASDPSMSHQEAVLEAARAAVEQAAAEAAAADAAAAVADAEVEAAALAEQAAVEAARLVAEQEAAQLAAEAEAAAQAQAAFEAARLVAQQKAPQLAAQAQAAFQAARLVAEEEAALLAAKEQAAVEAAAAAEEQTALEAAAAEEQVAVAEEQAAVEAAQLVAEQEAAAEAARLAVEEQAALEAAAAKEQAAVEAAQLVAEQEAAAEAARLAVEEQAAAAKEQAALEAAQLVAEQEAAAEAARLAVEEQAAAAKEQAALEAAQLVAEQEAARLAVELAEEEAAIQAELLLAGQEAAAEAAQLAAEEQAALEAAAAEEQAALEAAQLVAEEEAAQLAAEEQTVLEGAQLVGTQKATAAQLAAEGEAAAEQSGTAEEAAAEKEAARPVNEVPATLQQRLEAYYTKYSPGNLHKIPGLVKYYSKNENSEKALWQRLDEGYGTKVSHLTAMEQTRVIICRISGAVPEQATNEFDLPPAVKPNKSPKSPINPKALAGWKPSPQVRSGAGVKAEETASDAPEETASDAQSEADASGAKAEEGASGAQAEADASDAQAEEGASGAKAEEGVSGAQAEADASGAQAEETASGAKAEEGASDAPEAGASDAQAEEGASGTQAEEGASDAQSEETASGAQVEEGASDAPEETASGAKAEEGVSGAQAEEGASGAQAEAGASGAQAEETASGAQAEAGACITRKQQEQKRLRKIYKQRRNSGMKAAEAAAAAAEASATAADTEKDLAEGVAPSAQALVPPLNVHLMLPPDAPAEEATDNDDFSQFRSPRSFFSNAQAPVRELESNNSSRADEATPAAGAQEDAKCREEEQQRMSMSAAAGARRDARREAKSGQRSRSTDRSSGRERSTDRVEEAADVCDMPPPIDSPRAHREQLADNWEVPFCSPENEALLSDSLTSVYSDASLTPRPPRRSSKERAVDRRDAPPPMSPRRHAERVRQIEGIGGIATRRGARHSQMSVQFEEEKRKRERLHLERRRMADEAQAKKAAEDEIKHQESVAKSTSPTKEIQQMEAAAEARRTARRLSKEDNSTDTPSDSPPRNECLPRSLVVTPDTERKTVERSSSMLFDTGAESSTQLFDRLYKSYSVPCLTDHVEQSRTDKPETVWQRAATEGSAADAEEAEQQTDASAAAQAGAGVANQAEAGQQHAAEKRHALIAEYRRPAVEAETQEEDLEAVRQTTEREARGREAEESAHAAEVRRAKELLAKAHERRGSKA